MTDIPDAAIEAAAEAIIVPVDDPETDYRDIARAAIEAAMPAIREAIAQEVEAESDDLALSENGPGEPAYYGGMQHAANMVRGQR